ASPALAALPITDDFPATCGSGQVSRADTRSLSGANRVKRLKLRRFPRLGRPRFRSGGRWLARATGRLARFLFRSQIITVFFGLCVLGAFVGMPTRPAHGRFPYDGLFDQPQVMSYREAPTDPSRRFVVQLCAGGKIFSQYDIEDRAFQPPPSGRSYARTITGSTYSP